MLPLTPVSSGRPARLATRRLLLRWMSGEHAEALVVLCEDPQALRRRVGHASVFVVTARGAPDPLGLVVLLPGGSQDVVRVVAALLPEARGRGLAREAVAAVADWARDELGAAAVWERSEPPVDEPGA